MALDVTQFAITVDNKQAIKSIKVVEEALDTGLSKAARKADTHLQKIQENFGKIDRASNQFSNSVMKLSGTIFTLGAAKQVAHELWSAFSQFPETSKNMARLESSLQLLGNQLQTVFAPAVNIAADSLSRLLNKTDLPAWIDQAGTALATQTRIFEVTQQIRTLEGNRKRAGIKDFFLDFVGKGVDGDIARMDQRLQSLRATLADLQQNGLRANTAEPTTSASPALNQALADMARLNADLAAAERLRIPAGIALAEAGKQQIEVIKEQEEALKRLAVAADKALKIHKEQQAPKKFLDGFFGEKKPGYEYGQDDPKVIGSTVANGIAGSGPNAGRGMQIGQAFATGGPWAALAAVVLTNEKIQKAIDKIFEAAFALIDPIIDVFVPILDMFTHAVQQFIPVFANIADALVDVVSAILNLGGSKNKSGDGTMGYLFGGEFTRKTEDFFSPLFGSPSGPHRVEQFGSALPEIDPAWLENFISASTGIMDQWRDVSLKLRNAGPFESQMVALADNYSKQYDAILKLNITEDDRADLLTKLNGLQTAQIQLAKQEEQLRQAALMEGPIQQAEALSKSVAKFQEDLLREGLTYDQITARIEGNLSAAVANLDKWARIDVSRLASAEARVDTVEHLLDTGQEVFDLSMELQNHQRNAIQQHINLVKNMEG